MAYQSLILSDIHANLEALDAVLDHASATHGPPDEIWCLGDTVGYGPDPSRCLDRLRPDSDLAHDLVRRTQKIQMVKGNHEHEMLRINERAEFSEATVGSEVYDSWRWTYKELSDDQRAFLAELPIQYKPPSLPASVLLVHASPQDQHNRYHYLSQAADIEAVMADIEQTLCFFGHTHLACYFECDQAHTNARPRIFSRYDNRPVTLEGYKCFINPGTVGQPRWGAIHPETHAYEGNPSASYAWLRMDDNGACTVQCHFVDYQHMVQETVAKLRRITDFKVPERWINRLVHGVR